MLFVIVKNTRNCSIIKRSTIRPYNAYSLTIEMKDSLASSFDEAIELATYSNSESTVCSYLSIFETRIQSELYEKKKPNNTTSDNISEGD